MKAHTGLVVPLVYTSESHIGMLFHLLHLARQIGGVTKFAADSYLSCGARDLCGCFYSYCIDYCDVFASRAARRIAFLFIVFSGGLGWLLILAGQPNWLGSAPIDLISPEGFTFLAIYAFRISPWRACCCCSA